MSADDILKKPAHERFHLFMDAWERLRTSRDFLPTQEAADLLQAMFGLSGFKVRARTFSDDDYIAREN